ncbi:MAG TPA: hypothetical protein VM912_01720 [Terriglobales bacterium]|nr:hypothetical protein [Terriglobales bacterium]
MRRSLSVFLLCVSLFSSSSIAQQGGGQSLASGMPPRVGSDATIVDLLQQSHDLDKQAPLRLQPFLLRMQAGQVAELRPDLAREWANELFQLASQQKGQERAATQGTAMSILVRVDPDRALELLHAMTSDADTSSNMQMTPQMQMARQVFQVLASRDGEGALPTLEREAAFMGSVGRYPYSALGSAAANAVSKDWRDNKQHAIQVEQSVLDLAFSRYSQTAPTYFDDLDFGQMLQAIAGGLPPDSVQPALRLLVKNLLTTDVNKYQFRAEVYTSDGKSAKTDNAIDAAILHFDWLIHRDPDLVQQLESTRPQLRAALEYTKEGHARSMSFGGRVGAPRPQVPSRDPEAEARSEAMHFSHLNADVAIAKAKQLPAGPERASTLLQVARDIAGDHPEQAASLIAEASGGTQGSDDATQLNVISAEAYVAAAEQNTSVLHELLQQGFALANRIALAEPRGVSEASLVQIGIQYEPDLAMAFLNGLPPSYMKAQLLMEAASSLNLRRRLPLSSGAQPNAAKAN